MPLKTTIIIPALNEGAVIGPVVRALRECAALQAAGITDILVIDNGSADDTAAQAQTAGARVAHEPRRGYGRACLAGMLATDADIIVQMDGDGSDAPEDILRVWQPVRDGVADLAVGSRVRGRRERGALTPQQIAGNSVGALLLRQLYGVRVTDIGPLRAIRRDALARMQMAEMTYGWSVEMLAKAGRLGLRIREVPVDYRRRAGGESKVAGTVSGALKASWRILRTIMKYRGWVSSSRAVLFIVARYPVPGQTKTRLGNVIGHAQATDLYRAFLRDLGARFTAAARRDGYDLCWYYCAPPDVTEAEFAACIPPGANFLRQPEGDLGERLWYGFQTLHTQGYERIVVLGSDSPHIPAAWVRRAFAALEQHDVVIGPAQDGGYYLLGQRGDPTDCFTGVTMSTPAVYAQTVRALATQGRTLAYLPVTFDVDEAADLRQLAAALHAAPEEDAVPATLRQLDLLGERELVALEVGDGE